MYINPYSSAAEGKGAWMKSNFHTHAGTGPDTCGAYDLEEVVKHYKAAGYMILCISNHDLFTDTSHLKGKYGIGLINGFEYSKNLHMLCIGCKSLIEGEHQAAVNECVNQEGFVILCHPNWQHKEYWPWGKIDALKGYAGIEVFNGVIGRLTGTGLAEDTWDYLLSGGKLVWGFGNDDFHRWHDLNKSWTMIYSESNEENDVKSAIRSGSFYLSTGLFLNEITFDNNIIKLRASENACYPKNYQYTFIGKSGEMLHRQEGEFGEYKLSGNELYVRVKVMGEQGYVLWTQPIYNKNMFERP
ncbi:MAG TPA: hypothetical protein PK733_02305 [Clostridiales bacterium]|nr:hypothetical protein [Clostridiales bacterium]